ncbi:hypothetical protein ACFFMN_21670 [Planobispora siamensis]|uniref:DUF7224 domain-containing protein n=1 Tax=Planobispora siamensis TaxID=936338 RepID=A0A8J3WKL3_9ACTN|nr:hypothetical protein [Planobispora siamensis]GIH92883.1 hypothetical protein Psi01_35130 [Planobispora siamensis]
MPLHRWLRSSAAVAAFPFMIAYLIFVLGGSVEFLEDNWLSATVLVSSAGVLAMGPVCAAAGAWEGARLARGRIGGGVPVRPPVLVLAWSAWPILGGAAAGLLGAFLVLAAAMADVPGTPDPSVLAVALLVILAWTLVGFAVGRYAHPLLGVPLLLVGTWLWLAYPAALETFWVRHLTGNNLGFCCETHTVFHPGALYAQAIVATALAGAAMLAWARGGRTRRVWAGIAALPLAAAAVAIPLVRDMGPEAQVPRSDALVCGEREGIEVCLWPERGKRLDFAARTVVPAARRLSAGSGLPLPGRITEGPADGATSWRFAVPPGADGDDVVFGLATSLLPAEPPVCGPGWSGAEAYRPLSAWLALTAGAGHDVVGRRTGPQALDVAQRTLARPPTEQMRWFRHNLVALSRCDTAPREVSAL